MTTDTLPNRSSRFRMVAIAVALTLMALIATALWFAPALRPDVSIRAPLTACDLAANPCEAELPGGARIRLAVTPRPIPVMERIRLAVDLQGVAAERVEVDFSGVDMNMGFNRFVLLGQGDGPYVGEGVLPVCTRNRMEWEATVLVETDGKLIAAPFRFETVRR